MNRIALKIACAVCVIAVVACGVMIFGRTFHIGERYANAEQYTAGGATLNGRVKNLDIHWTDGAVAIAYHAQDTVEISETAPKAISKDAALRWWLDGDTLRVQYAKTGFFSVPSLQKALTVTLPEGTALENVTIDATSADVTVPQLRADDVQIDLTSGDMTLKQTGAAKRVALSSTSGVIRAKLEAVDAITAGITSGAIQIDQSGAADSVRLSSTSGDISATLGNANVVSVGATSGAIALTGGAVKAAELKNTSGKVSVKLAAFDTLKIDVTSGDVTAALPSQPGYKVEADTTSGRFDYDVPLKRDGDRYICGDGSAQVRIDSTSGNVRLEAADGE